MKKTKKILVTGPVPPPAGGISIHIQRLCYLLKDEYTFDFIDESSVKKEGVFNIKSLNLIGYFKRVLNSDLLLVHSGNKLFKKIHILSGRLFAKKVIITLHGYGPKRKQPFRAIDSFFFNMAHKIILVNPDIANRVPLPGNKCIVQHAFLPPIVENEAPLPSKVSNWLVNAKNLKKTIVCANASRLDMHNNQDLYGLDMCIEVVRRLTEKRIPISFVFTVSSLDSGIEYFNKNLQLISDLKLQDHFMLISEKLSFVKLIEKADIVIRPTNTDGDALTVREAIYLKKQAIASDVVERPKGTILFKTRNNDDLEIKLENAIKNSEANTGFILGNTNETPEYFKQFYSELFNNILLK